MPEIRETIHEDAGLIHQNIKAATTELALNRNYYPWLKKHYSVPILVEKIDKEISYVAVTKADLPVGAVFYNPETNYVSGLYIHPFFQKQGIAKMLLTHLFTHNEISYATCITREENILAQKIMEKFNFKIKGEPRPIEGLLNNLLWVEMERKVK